MARSAQPALKANLFAALKAWQQGLTDVQISYGWMKSPANEFLFLGNIRNDGETTATLGTNRPREEHFTLFCLIKTEKKTVDQQIATERGYAIAAELETLLRGDPTVGGAVRLAAVAGISLEELANDTTRAAVLEVEVACQARI
jgi:hypothetical protein